MSRVRFGHVDRIGYIPLSIQKSVWKVITPRVVGSPIPVHVGFPVSIHSLASACNRCSTSSDYSRMVTRIQNIPRGDMFQRLGGIITGWVVSTRSNKRIPSCEWCIEAKRLSYGRISRRFLVHLPFKLLCCLVG